MCFLFEKYLALNQSEFPHPLHIETRENYEYMHIMSNIVCGVQNRVGHVWKTQINSNFAHDCSFSQQRYINSISLAGSQIYIGYYTVARRYEFYVRVARTISHE